MRPPPFLFDLDGTLVDSLGDITASANHVRAAFALPPVGTDVARDWVGDGAAKLLERAVAPAVPTDGDPPPVADLLALYDEHHRDQCTRLVVPYPGVRDHLAELAAAGHALGVVTNKPERFARRILDHLDLAATFAVVVGGDTTAERKPSPLPIHTALDALGEPRDAGRGTMVGDGLQDVRAGRAAGLRTIAVLFGFRDEATLRAEGADVYWRAFGVPA